MLVVILSWAYMLFLCLIAGTGLQAVFRHTGLASRSRAAGLTQTAVTGAAALTVYAEYYSIFGGVNTAAHVVMLAVLAFPAVLCRRELRRLFPELRRIFFSGEGILQTALILVIAFYCSRGPFHTDTGIYHAQAIRIIEEYGLLKGMGNLQEHFAYNSSYLAFAALFTMSRILPAALHTTTGFFAALVSCQALHRLLHLRRHRSRLQAAAAAAALLYLFTDITGSVSPATDYGTMYFLLYLFGAWIACAEEGGSAEEGEAKLLRCGQLSVLALFCVSLKLSAACAVLLALYPLAGLLRRKKGRHVLLSAAEGAVCILPFLVRNVLISGWLFYPVEQIDLFRVVWKVPAEYLRTDAAQIKAWGRCLYDVEKLGEPLQQWLPVWYHGQQSYEQMLIKTQFIGGAALLFVLCRRLRRRQVRPAIALYFITLAAGIAFWFLTAPFIRYGLAFLLLFPLCALGEAAEELEKAAGAGHRKAGLLSEGALCVLCLCCFAGWIVNYAGDDLKFIRENAGAGYYVLQEPFEDSETASEERNGCRIYYSVKGTVNSYYHCPSTCYRSMLERTELIGNTIESGFRAR
ncbi:MAG: hypothetical protein LKJ76_00845 [Lachnospiraceae bacterium]|jgi:hypothetical protein|nr:hypothetical protein [Lachnospiraceae bacterium]